MMMQQTYQKPTIQQVDNTKKGPNPQNYKIVNCKYWEKDGTCRYGQLCTFAHGDDERRSKAENIMLTQQPPVYFDPNMQMSEMQGMNVNDPNLMMPPFNMMNPYSMGFDPNMMMNPNFMMGFPTGFDPSFMMMNPNMQNFPQNNSGGSGNTNL